MKLSQIGAVAVIITLPMIVVAQEPHVLKHDGWVAALAFAPDGKTLASAGADKVVRLWEVGTWKPKGVLKGHTDCVNAVSFFPSGKWLATGSFDHTAKLWPLDGPRKASFTAEWHKGAVLSVLVDTENETSLPMIFTGSTEGRIRLGTVCETILPKEIGHHKSWVNSMSFDRNSTLLASGSSDGTVRIHTGGQSESLEGGAGEVRCVAFSPDGKTLAAGNRYGTVRVWDVASRKEIKTLTGHASDVWAIAFSPDGKTLAAADTDWKKPSKIKLWDTATWKERGSLPCPGEILCLAYSPKGNWLAAGSWDKTVRIFAIEQKK
jgi:WD40 repeat protein